jgi:hypothetical protein
MDKTIPTHFCIHGLNTIWRSYKFMKLKSENSPWSHNTMIMKKTQKDINLSSFEYLLYNFLRIIIFFGFELNTIIFSKFN